VNDLNPPPCQPLRDRYAGPWRVRSVAGGS